MSQPQGPLIEARPKGQLEPRLSPRTRRLVELLVEAEFATRAAKRKRDRKQVAATGQPPEPAQAPTIASLCIHAGYADTDAGRSAARRDVATAQARAYRSQLRHLALDDAFGSIVGNIASIAMGNSSSDKAQIEAFAQLVAYQHAHLPEGDRVALVIDYEVSEAEIDREDRSQGPEGETPHEDPGFGKAGGSVGAGSALTSDLPLVTYDPPLSRDPAEVGWPELAAERPDIVSILRGAGYEVVEGAEAVLAAIGGDASPGG